MPTSVILAKAFQVDDIKPKSGVVRVTEYEQSMVIQSNGKQGTKGKITHSQNMLYYFRHDWGSIHVLIIKRPEKSDLPFYQIYEV